MEPTEVQEGKTGTKMVGGQIPIALYWEFKQAQAERQENSTKALEIALRLYIDAPIKNTEG
jgi:hypothetical protein